ncbi:MAG TPA: SDR family oxidoreductase [Erysipelotrichaceae bacterium]|jgi:UDP-glucuronate decarboxylase|nr:SDR family oxidoreductase [Erysipelotrichia bacterium]HPX32686.1 SDR family oxidoreductase [Erysipelotrichaceae bacterium]HQA85365.1 SDR family oxidoreductase [Erysipelotrichaceae bacterium]
MKRILVTGGAGFIGSHLCKKLLQQGHKVICLDNMYTGIYDNIKSLYEDKNFVFINADITNSIDLKVDQIYNLACPASPVHYQHDPIMTAKTSFLGALNVLELAKKNKARVLQASTSEVYGDPLIHPQTELYRGNVNAIGPRACYDEGKRIAETLFFDYQRQYGVDIRVVRIFNTYGPNMLEDDGRVVSNFIVQALNNEDITIYGDGTQTRSFCYVDDLVDGLLKMMENDNFSGPVNLGNPHEITVYELAQIIIEKTGSNSKIVYKDLPEDDPTKRRPAIELAKTKLNWQPTVTINEGLDRTIEYFKRRFDLKGGVDFK